MDKLINLIKGLLNKQEIKPAPVLTMPEINVTPLPEVRIESKYRKTNRPVNKLILHCTASDYAHHDNVETIDKWHKEKGWSGIGYHYVILKDGSVKLGRDIDKIGAHCQGQNTGSIGICLTGYKFFSHAQFVSLKLLFGELCNLYNLKRSDVYPHSKFANKACPNFDIYEVI